jgi:hypothetical protein
MGALRGAGPKGILGALLVCARLTALITPGWDTELLKTSDVRDGGCLCNAIRYRALGDPINQRVCHCRRCQRVLGTAFNARLLFDETAVHIEGDPTWRKIAAELEAGFCGACGSTVFMRRRSASTLAIMAGSLDRSTAFRPTMHVHTASMQAWLRLDDGLPQYAGGPSHGEDALHGAD